MRFRIWCEFYAMETMLEIYVWMCKFVAAQNLISSLWHSFESLLFQNDLNYSFAQSVASEIPHFI